MDAENRAAAQLAAENSAENHCRDRKIAGELLQTFNAYQAVQDMNLQAVDIEHLTTIKFDKEQHVYVCHGAFVLMNGIHRTGILSTRLNVAGNVISTWHTDPS
jgi:predicted rRNA methylase YqxC with S4 and FtsJ domains